MVSPGFCRRRGTKEPGTGRRAKGRDSGRAERKGCQRRVGNGGRLPRSSNEGGRDDPVCACVGVCARSRNKMKRLIV